MNRLEHLLTILSEECAELSQATSKALRFGVNEQRDLPINNRECMQFEYNDIVAVVQMLASEGVFLKFDTVRIEAKKQKVEKYLLYSQECGTISDAQDKS